MFVAQVLSSSTEVEGFLSFVLGLWDMAKLSAEVKVSVKVKLACTGCGLQPGPAVFPSPPQTRSCLPGDSREQETLTQRLLLTVR